jgi:hypothetical protein
VSVGKRRSSPYHKRWHGDALKGYEVLTLEERGAYTTLLDQMYDYGGPIKERFVCAFLSCDVRVWKRLRASLVDQHRKLRAYTDDDGIAWLVNDRVQAELGLPTYAELVANLSPKFPIATPELSDKSPEKPKENNIARSDEKPNPAPSIPLPFPETPIAPKGADPPLVRKADVEAIWEITPRKSRERSSKGDIERALNAAVRRGRTVTDVRAGLVGYFESPGATKDGGDFVKGVHRMIEMDRWEAFLPDPEPAATVGATNPAEAWRRRVEAFKRDQYWNRLDWGPAPGKPDCAAPIEILAACGFGGEGVVPFAPRSDAA